MIVKQHFKILVLLPFFILSSCSSSEENEEAGVIKQTTDSVAHEAVDRITSPIEKAKRQKRSRKNTTLQPRRPLNSDKITVAACSSRNFLLRTVSCQLKGALAATAHGLS